MPGPLTMLDAATGTLLGTVEAAEDRRIAHSAVTGDTAEFGDYWAACQWLRGLFPITPAGPRPGFDHQVYRQEGITR